MVTIEEQIEGLRKTKTILENFATLMEIRMSKAEDKLDELESMSLPVEIAEKYRFRYLEDDKSIINELVHTIRTDHVDYIEKKIDQLGGVPKI